MTEALSKERTAVEIWQELNSCIQLSNIINDDMTTNSDLLLYNMYQMRIHSLTTEAFGRFNLVTDTEIGDPILPLAKGQKYFSQWYAETADQAFAVNTYCH
jgi:hypothetical protein